MSLPTTPSFLEAFGNGDDDEISKRFLDRYTPFVRNVVFGVLRSHAPRLANPCDVEDFTATVSADVAFKIIREYHADERERAGGFRRWLRKAARSTLIDHLRLRRRDQAEGGPDVAEVLAQHPDPHSGGSVLDRIAEEHDKFAKTVAVEDAFTALHAHYLSDYDQRRAGVLQDLGLEGLYRHGNSKPEAPGPCEGTDKPETTIAQRHGLTPNELSKLKIEMRTEHIRLARELLGESSEESGK